jgi:hypothetical protein
MRNRRFQNRTFKNKMLDAMRVEQILSPEPYITDAECEWRFMKYICKRAFDRTDPEATTILRELLSRSYAPLKAAMAPVEFEFTEGATPIQQVNQIIGAVSRGEISPDVGVALANVIKSAIDIEAVTELKQRVEALEADFDDVDSL